MTKTAILRAAVLTILIICRAPSLGQSAPNLNQANVTVEGAIRLSWNSAPGEVYQIQCADSLIDTNTGTITWQMLYDSYPSQGTNTFWLDTGNYLKVPPILHPAKAPMRFYRIVDLGPDTASSEPAVTIVSPANGLTASGELTINVAASTDQAGGLITTLYVDGQQMRLPITSTNWTDGTGVTNYLIDTYTINTCEWPNGNHILFATATAESAPSGTILGAPPVLEGHGVSPFVSATFNNLVTRISFSEPFFDPALGQTQQVRAVFAANVGWTLVIRDANSNAVRNATGSGASLLFPWDGKGDGGTNLDPGVYHYYISAQTNGQPLSLDEPSADDGSGSQPAVALNASLSASESTGAGWYPRSEEQALRAGWGFYYMPSPPLPPVYTNGVWMNWTEVFGPQPLMPVEVSLPAQQSSSPSLNTAGAMSVATNDAQTDDATESYSGSSTQAAPATPDRPPTAPKDGTPGTFGIAWQTYKANGSSGFTPQLPLATTPPLTTYVQLEGHGTANRPNFQPLRYADTEAINFGAAMNAAAWSPAFTRPDDDLKIEDLRGTSTGFNGVDIGFLLLHCVYGTSFDYLAGSSPVKQMYFPIAAGGGAQYLRMSEMKFGGDGTNGLKWMAIAACSSLYHANWSSMQSQQVYPYTSGLHLLLGVDTKNETADALGQAWVRYMIGDPKASPPVAGTTIRLAWYFGATYAYTNAHAVHSVSPMVFAVAGDQACRGDMLQTKTNTVLQGGARFYDTQQVYPPQ